MNSNGLIFLNKLYKDLADSKEVLNSVKRSGKSTSISREDRIKIYMDRLNKIHSSDNFIKLVRAMYYNKYVIKEEDIPVHSLNGQSKKAIISAQKESLDKWINYLTNENVKYPMWAKYWVFQGMLKIGDYDEANGTYLKRTKKTITPFIDANPEIIAKCIDDIVRFTDNKSIDDKEVYNLVNTGSFLKLYTMYLKRFKRNIFVSSNSNDGIWIKYNRNNKEDAIKLAKSLHGYGTRWCTASEITAINQLCGGDDYVPGDFYVYYTKDENSEYKVPRIAIRLEDFRIVEVRGVDESQNLEDGLEEILKEKLKSLDNNNIDRFLKMVDNAKKLSTINYKNRNKLALTDEEIIFIYEIKEKIETFGLVDDPRIKKIRNSRNPQSDYNLLKNNEYKIMFLINKKISNLSINDKKIIMEAVKQNGLALRHANRKIDNYEELALIAVKNNGTALQYVDKNITNYNKIIIEAAKQSSNAFEWIDKNIENFNKIAIEAAKSNGLSLQYVNKNTENYEEIALEAVKINGYAIKFVPKTTRNYEQIAMAAVKQNFWAFEHVDNSTNNYKEVLVEAIKHSPRILDFLSPTLENYKELAITAINNNFQALHWLRKTVKKYKEIVLEIVMNNNFALQYVSVYTDFYTEIALEVVKQNGLSLQYVNKYAKDYKKIAITAINENVLALQYISTNNKNYNEILAEALKLDANILEKISKKNKTK